MFHCQACARSSLAFLLFPCLVMLATAEVLIADTHIRNVDYVLAGFASDGLRLIAVAVDFHGHLSS